jgi:hypothetical protein
MRKLSLVVLILSCGCFQPVPNPDPGSMNVGMRETYFRHSDGDTVDCTAPRASVVQIARNSRVAAAISRLGSVSAAISDSIVLAQINRPASTDEFEARKFALCEAYGNDGFTREQYGQWLAALTVVGPAPVEVPAARPFRGVILDFVRASTGENAEGTDARPYLRQFGISVEQLVPEGSELIVTTDRTLYQGPQFVAGDAQIYLTQTKTGNAPASFTLVFSEPLDSLRFTRPALYALTSSGMTNPAWSARALDAAGRQVSVQGEELARTFENVAEASYVLKAPGLVGISAVRFDSDPQLDGRPFAAVSTIMIKRLVLYRRRG